MLFSETQSTYTSHCSQWEPWGLTTSENLGPWDAVFPDVTCRQHYHPAYNKWNREIRKGLCYPTALYVTTQQKAELPSSKYVYITVLSGCSKDQLAGEWPSL